MRLIRLFKCIYFLMLLTLANKASAQTYSVEVGQQLTLTVPSVSMGYVDKAIWGCSKPAILFVDKSTTSATITVNQQFDGYATIELLYVEKYVDNKGFTRANTYTKNFYISCRYNPSNGSSKNATSLSVTPEITVPIGQKAKIYYNISPAGSKAEVFAKSRTGTYFNGLTFYQSEGYAEGYARAAGVENVIFYFYNQNNEQVSATCTVTVYDPTWIEPKTVSLPEAIIIYIGEEKKLLPTYTPSNATALLKWSSDNTNIAYVSKVDGLLKAKSEGITEITLKLSNGLTCSCNVIVLPKDKELVPGITQALKRCAEMVKVAETEIIK